MAIDRSARRDAHVYLVPPREWVMGWWLLTVWTGVGREVDRPLKILELVVYIRFVYFSRIGPISSYLQSDVV